MFYSPRKEFQFPSNGKVLSDSLLFAAILAVSMIVSIPFQRESPFGQNDKGDDDGDSGNSFNSLPTGKSFRTSCIGILHTFMGEKFQFPSNGKVLSDQST